MTAFGFLRLVNLNSYVHTYYDAFVFSVCKQILHKNCICIDEKGPILKHTSKFLLPVALFIRFVLRVDKFYCLKLKMYHLQLCNITQLILFAQLSSRCSLNLFLNSKRFLTYLQVNTPFVRQQAKNFGTEVVAWSKGVIGDSEKPIVISGPSGVGKGTLISKLMEEFPSMFGFSVSHTTRAPREKEQNGVHYHFTERSKMEKEIKDGKFLEFANVHGNLYGTSVEAVEVVADSGKVCMLHLKYFFLLISLSYFFI